MSKKVITHQVDFDTKRLEEDQDKFTFEGLASTFGNVDLVGDIVDQGAFADSIQRLGDRAKARGKRGLMPVLFNHNSSKPLGVFVELRETDQGLFATGEMPKTSRLVSDEIVPQMKIGSIDSMSIGFTIDEQRFDGDVRVLQKVSLVETSLVTANFAANPQAAITDLKSLRLTLDDLQEDDVDLREIERRLRQGVPLSKSLAERVAPMLMEFRRDPEIQQKRREPASSGKGADEGDAWSSLDKILTEVGARK